MRGDKIGHSTKPLYTVAARRYVIGQAWQDWFFTKETLRWMFSGIGVVILVALSRWLFAKRDSRQVETTSTSMQSTVTASDGGMAVGGNITATAQLGGTVIVGSNRDEPRGDSTLIAALKALSQRLLSQLLTLPFPRPTSDRQIRGAVLWTEEDLQRLETLAESTDEATITLVSSLVMHLRFIKEIVGEIQSVNPKMGYDYAEQWPQQGWEENFQEARSALQTLVGSEQ